MKIMIFFIKRIHGAILRVLVKLKFIRVVKPKLIRVVILHNHIFKNAGTTIDWALQKNFNNRFVDHRNDEEMRRGADYLRTYLIENEQILALSSHHLTIPLPKIAGIKLITILMIRHPIERVTSVYNFEKSQTSDTHPGVIHARKLPLGDYIIWRMKPDVGATIRNFQVRKMLPPRKLGQEQISNKEMAYLKKQVKKTALLGLVHRFDECMVLFEDYLGGIYLNIDLSYIAQNIGQKSHAKQEVKLEKLRSEIGADIYNLLIENNQQDLQLLDLVEKEIESRISNTHNFSAKLANFQARCIAKSGTAP